MSLTALGFGPYFQAQLELADAGEQVPARIVSQGQDRYRVGGCRAPFAKLSGKALHRLQAIDRPAVGDWVLVDDADECAIIHSVLPRRTELIRRAAGSQSAGQVIAANVDVYFIVTSANRDFNPRRIERYLAIVWESGAEPVVVINKADLVDDPQALIGELGPAALGVPVIALSATEDEDLGALIEHLGPGRTAGLIGSSGVGKSTLTNRLLGKSTQAVRELGAFDKGQHTTTARELFELPAEGGLLIDTPGMRELGLVDHEAGVEASFADIAELAEHCRFRDCEHGGEPGCAVAEAIEDGTLDSSRLDDYRHLQRELAAAARKQDPQLAGRSKRRWKEISKLVRAHYKNDPKR